MDAIVYDKVGKEAEKVREALYGIYPQETITDAAIASFDDGADSIPVKALTVGIEPVQDLHGYSNPWPAGGGKNLCDPSKKTVNNIGDVRYYASDGFTLKAGVTYTFSITGVTIAPNGLYIVKQSDFSSLISAYNATAITYTPSEDIVAAFRCLWNQGPTESIYANIKAQLEIGSSATTFSPYENICPISGHTGAEVTRTGKNLLNYLKPIFRRWGNLSYEQRENGIYMSGVTNSLNNVVIISFSEMELGLYPLVPYTISYEVERVNGTGNGDFYLEFYNANATRIKLVLNPTHNSIQFTLTDEEYQETSYIYAVFKPNRADLSVGSSVDLLLKPQIELGSAATDFEPYTGNQISVTFPSEAGTVYGGEDEVTTGKLKKTMGMVDLGTLTWTLVNGGSRPDFFNATLPTEVLNNNYISSMYYKKGNPYGNDEDLIVNVFNTGGNGNLLIRNTAYTTAADFKTAMSGVQLCYELAEPVEYDLTPQTMETLYGTNNIWASTGNIEKLTYRADLGKYIDSHITTAVANALNA